MDIKPSYNINNQKITIKTKIKENVTYSKSVKTIIGRMFIKLISKYFPPYHKFVKIFNKNTIKLSYSCMPSIKYSTKIFQPKFTEPQKLSKYLVKEDCPMNGLCLTSSTLYQHTIKCSDSKYKQKRFKEICKTTFKKRYASQKKSFSFFKLKNQTILSIEYGILKQKQQAPRLTWEIKGQYKAYNPTLKKCNLCLNEKLAIMDNPEKNLLNKRSEVIYQCCHQSKLKVVNPT